MEKSGKKHHMIRRIILGILIVLVIAGGVYCRFGGFSTGKSADTTEFAKYAEQISEIKIPKETRVIALGEATHGNAEFQQLKLDARVYAEQNCDEGFSVYISNLGKSCQYV